jgi:hypothetical protein
MFVAEVIAQAERKILKMMTQMPMQPSLPADPSQMQDPAQGDDPSGIMPPGNGGAPDPNAVPPAGSTSSFTRSIIITAVTAKGDEHARTKVEPLTVVRLVVRKPN